MWQPAEADDVGERHAELPCKRRAHGHVARRKGTAAQQRVVADAAHERAQPLVGVPDAGRQLGRLAQLRQPRWQLQRERGEQRRQRDRRERRERRALPVPAREREQARQPDGAEHADDGRGRKHEARQAREIAGGGQQRDDGDPAQRAGQQHPCAAIGGGEQCERPGRQQRQLQRPLRHVEDGLQRAVVATLRALRAAQCVAGGQ